jgi:hypothetical protein
MQDYLSVKVNTDVGKRVSTTILEPTRNLYMKTETYLANKINKDIYDNRSSTVRRFANENMIPASGINVGGMPGSTLSSNYVDIESELYGMNNLNAKYQTKTRKYCFTPRIKKLKEVAFFERPELFIPEPLVIEKNQRPIIP